MMQMLGRLMWIGVGAVAVKALEAGLHNRNFGNETARPASNGNGNGNGASTASSARPARRGSRRKAAAH